MFSRVVALIGRFKSGKVYFRSDRKTTKPKKPQNRKSEATAKPETRYQLAVKDVNFVPEVMSPGTHSMGAEAEVAELWNS